MPLLLFLWRLSACRLNVYEIDVAGVAGRLATRRAHRALLACNKREVIEKSFVVVRRWRMLGMAPSFARRRDTLRRGERRWYFVLRPIACHRPETAARHATLRAYNNPICRGENGVYYMRYQPASTR